MFPNMRLFLGALLASIVVLCCGFGVFAAFGVNHEPLSRLPADTIAMQLVANEAAGPPPAWRVPVSARFEASETVSDVRIDRIMTDAPTALPMSRVTIQSSSFLTVSTVRPEPAIDVLEGRASPRHEPQPIGQSVARSATAALSAPTVSTAPIANVSKQPAPSVLIATASAPAASPASTITALVQQAPAASRTSAATTPVQQSPAAETQPAQPTSDVKPEAVSETGESTTAPMPTVAIVEQSSNPAPALQPADMVNTPIEGAVPEPKARPALTDNAARWTLRKEVRQALQRRRLAARRRIAAKTAANFGQSGFQNSTVFQSAPTAFQQRPATNRRVAQKSSSGAAGSPNGWPTAQ